MERLNYKPMFFWLHIKKSAGTSTRMLLKPYYIELDREKKPANFIQSRPEEYNDILNNYRVVLGEYQFKRALFAKKYLYGNNWDSIYSFAFSREPVDRCLSMFYYLYWRDLGYYRNLKRSVIRSLRTGKSVFTKRSAFDVFLGLVSETRAVHSFYDPLGNHFSTHVASMWDDISDCDSNVLIKKIYRLENLVEGLNNVFEECGIDNRIEKTNHELNRNARRGFYAPTALQKRKIEELYAKDFDIYETSVL